MKKYVNPKTRVISIDTTTTMVQLSRLVGGDDCGENPPMGKYITRKKEPWEGL